MEQGKDLSIVIAGEAGMGIETTEGIVTRVLKETGYYVFSCKEFMSRVRGGSNSTQIRVSSKRHGAYLERIDLFISLDEEAYPHVSERLSPHTVIIGDRSILPKSASSIDIPFLNLAVEAGNRVYTNSVASGAILGIFGIPLDRIERHIKARFEGKGEGVIEGNLAAIRKGYERGEEIIRSGEFHVDIPLEGGKEKNLLLSGTEAVSLGALTGGCNVVTAYPMSPSTGVLTFMAQKSTEFDIVVEQVEDEIAAVNMAIGAWYAGGRALVTTSGGGFALMCEGLSLAGVTETPLVVHLGQRPGPATGLPTRTEQGDLNLALHAGHGDFPRILLAPGSPEEAFLLSERAFDLAERFQVPVIILTDQFFLDATFTVASLPLDKTAFSRHIVEAGANYRRYPLAVDGVSPRAVPGYGVGLVAADSHEHDEAGHISENLPLRKKTVEKRLKKGETVAKAALPPTLIGPETYRHLVVCWGSSVRAATEAIECLGREDTACLHFSQIWPIHTETTSFLGRAKKIMVMEGNAAGQFANLLERETQKRLERRILRYDGFPFSVEGCARDIARHIEG